MMSTKDNHILGHFGKYHNTISSLISLATYNGPKRTETKTMLIQILWGQTKSIMVFSEVDFVRLDGLGIQITTPPDQEGLTSVLSHESHYSILNHKGFPIHMKLACKQALPLKMARSIGD